MATVKATERSLAIVTNWGVFGSFALGFAMSGFVGGQVAAGLVGFALVVAGFAAHVIINQLFGTGFSRGEIVVGFMAFGVALLSFIAAWLFDPHFGAAGVTVGLVGFGAIIVSFMVYLVTKYGLKGSFSMFHVLQHR